MASGTTTVHSLPYPLSTDAPSVHTDIQALANALDGTLLTPTGFATSQTLAAGRLAVSTASPVTFTLPAPAANAVVGVFAKVASGASPVTVSGSAIYGVGMSGVSSFVLGAPGAFVILRSDGTNWYVTAGQQDSGWVALTLLASPAITANPNGPTPGARLLGDRVWLRGSMTLTGSPTVTGPATIPGTIPLPAKNLFFLSGITSSNSTLVFSSAITNTQLVLQGSTLEVIGGLTVTGQTLWLIESSYAIG